MKPMLRLSFALSLVALGLSACAIPMRADAATVDPTDYSKAEQYHRSDSAASLLGELRSLTAPGKPGSYDDLWTTYKKAYVRADGTMMDYYSNASAFRPGTDQAGSYHGEGDVYNREHSIPKSWWGGAESNQGADPFIVIPTDGWVNNMRGNYPLGETDNPSKHSENSFSKFGPSSVSGYSGSVFEPDDSVKGDLARITFYAIAKYEGSYNWKAGYGDSTFSGSASKNYGLTDYAVKLYSAWSELDPVDEWEIGVNDRLYAIQGNRNPFVDHPEYANTLWGSVTGYTEYTHAEEGGDDSSDSSSSLDPSTSEPSSEEPSTPVPSSEESESSSPSSSSSSSSSSSTPVEPSSETITIDYDSQGVPETDDQATISQNGYRFGGRLKRFYSDSYHKLWFTANAGYVHNVDDLGIIDSIELYYGVGGSGSAAHAVSYLSEPLDSHLSSPINGASYSSSTGNTSRKSTPSGQYGYFNVSSTNSKNLQLSKIVITRHSADAPVTPTLTSITTSGQDDEFHVGDGFSYHGTCYAHYSDGSEKLVIPDVDSSAVDMDHSGTYEVILSYTEDDLTVTCSYSVTVVADLREIYSRGHTCAYEVGDAFSYDGTCYAVYEDGGVKEVTPNVSLPDTSSPGEKTVTLTYEESGVQASFDYTIWVAEKDDSHSSSGQYKLLTGTSDLSAGDKLVLAIPEKGFTATTISSDVMGKVASSFDNAKTSLLSLGEGTVEFTLGGSAGAWTLGHEGALLGATAAKKLAWNKGTTNWSISIDSDGAATIQNGTSTYGRILYNASSPRFTTYTSATSSSMLLPSLYRYEGYVDPDYEDAKAYAVTFLSAFTCDPSGDKAPDFETTWASLEYQYNYGLGMYARIYFDAASADEEGNLLQRALARYEYVVAKYGYKNYMNRDISASSFVAKRGIEGGRDNLAFILAISCVSVAATLGFFVLAKRRKQD